ncbi:MAG: type II toxin-antitoxin system RelE/ParE family toxin [Gammaproteobacteria bacterium]
MPHPHGARCSRLLLAARLSIAARSWKGVRSCSHGRYLILFRSSATDVLIVGVLHGARDLLALLLREQ